MSATCADCQPEIVPKAGGIPGVLFMGFRQTTRVILCPLHAQTEALMDGLQEIQDVMDSHLSLDKSVLLIAFEKIRSILAAVRSGKEKP